MSNDKLATWNRMKPEDRDYDRFVARRIPAGASWEPETEAGNKMRAEIRLNLAEAALTSCSCHIAAPCSRCLTLDDGAVRAMDLR